MNNEFTNAYIMDLNANTNRFGQLQAMYSEEVKDRLLTEKRMDEFNQLVKNLLMIAIIDEQLAELNYMYSYSLEKTEGKTDFDPEFEKHEEEERGHKYDLINRLRELDSSAIFAPMEQWKDLNSQGLGWQQEFSDNSSEVLVHRLNEELDAVKFYELAVAFTRGTDDTTTYTLFKKIKEDEEEHVKDLRDLGRDHGFVE